MKYSVLVVDDDASILEGYRRTLGQHFELYLAQGPFQGIEKLEGGPEYSVVVADMRMPEMNGIEFLKRVRARSPLTRRIMLSGDAEQSTAVDAVNLGQVSAFLSKPCPSQRLVAAVRQAAEDWEQQRQERVALRAAQAGAVQALTEMLRAADPALYRRGQRIRSLAERLMKARGLTMDWQMEAAAELSQAGLLYLSNELRGKIEAGDLLDSAEEALVAGQAALGAAWLKSIPGFDGIAEAMALQGRDFDAGIGAEAIAGQALPLTSRVLRLAKDLDCALQSGGNPVLALECLEAEEGRYDPELLCACHKMELGRGAGDLELRDIADLRPGMTFAEDLVDSGGTLLARQGEALDVGLALRLVQRVELGAVLMISAAL